MRGKSILLLVLALGCGLIAAIGVTQVISQDSGGAKESVEMVNILVAKEDISGSRKLTPEMVTIEAWPKNRVPKDAITDIKAIEGMRARSEILADDPIRRQKLLGKGDRQTPTSHIVRGMRAVPIKIEKDSNTGLIRPGDRVDVLANIQRNTQEGIEQSRTITLLQNVEVFAIDDNFIIDPDSEEGDTVTAKTATLLLSSKQAQKVDLAQKLGRLRLIMRSPDDEEVTADLSGISTAELLGNPQDTKPKEDPLETVSTRITMPSPVHQTWKIRLLAGADVADVTLKEQEGNDGKKVWHLIREGEPTEPSGIPTAAVSPLGPIDSSLVPPGLEPSE